MIGFLEDLFTLSSKLRLCIQFIISTLAVWLFFMMPLSVPAVVLDGDYPKDERLLHAVQLWKGGYAPNVVLSAKLAEWQTYVEIPGIESFGFFTPPAFLSYY